MIATTMRATSRTPRVPRAPAIVAARLCLAVPCACSERLDGAWWPRSRDLRRELPPLIAALDMRFGRISRVTVDGSQWPEPPRQVAVAGRTVDVGWSRAGGNLIEVCVLSNNAGRWDLLVVPPDCEFAESALLMAAAADGLDRHVAGQWFTRTTADRTAAAKQRVRESVWESEGGWSPGGERSAPTERHPETVP